MRSRQQAVIQGNWMERPAFQSKTARTPKCDNDVLVSARHILWHVGKGKSGTVIPPLNLLHELPKQTILYPPLKRQLHTVTDTKKVFDRV